MKKNVLTSIITNLLLITFVIVWIIPTVGLFVSSFRDKDLLATSGWWTTFKTNKVNEIYRTKTSEYQIEENGMFFIKGNLLDKNSISFFTLMLFFPVIVKILFLNFVPKIFTLSFAASSTCMYLLIANLFPL